MSSDPVKSAATKKRKRLPKKKSVAEEEPEVLESIPEEPVAHTPSSAPSPAPVPAVPKPVKRLTAKDKTKKLQRSTKLVLSKSPIVKWIRSRYNEINKESSGIGLTATTAGDNTNKVRFSSDAVLLAQEGLEAYLSDTVRQAKRVMDNRGRNTLTVQDIRVSKCNQQDELSKQITHELQQINPLIVKRKSGRKTKKANGKKQKKEEVVPAPVAITASA